MKSLFAALVLAAGLAVPAGAATVVNGSFEEHPAVGTWGVFTDITGWHTTSGSGIEIQTNPTLSTIDAQDGNSYVELDSNNNSSMSQNLMLSAGNYLLRFYYSPRTNNSQDNVIDYALGGLVSGSLAGPGMNPTTAVGSWTLITRMFTVAATDTFALSFAASGISSSAGGLLDNVSVAAVPLPAAGFMLFGAIAGLGALRRRDKNV